MPKAHTFQNFITFVAICFQYFYLLGLGQSDISHWEISADLPGKARQEKGKMNE